ncbi:hypothetical protein HUA74_44205, partial [Myxococcus sp. CA051A]|nr:hypothetical protein [Myxococcus sp. CA051A]
MQLQGIDHKSRELKLSSRSILESEHDLDERAMAQGALDVEFLDELLERKLLVGVGTEAGVASAKEDVEEGRVAGEASGERESVDEESDEGFELRTGAVG